MIFVYENLRLGSGKTALKRLFVLVYILYVSKLLAGFQGLGDFFVFVNKQEEMAQHKVLSFFPPPRLIGNEGF